VRSDPAVLDAYLGGEDDASTQRELADEAAHAPVLSVTPVRRVREKLGESTSLLTLRGVTAGYGGGDILKDVTLDVPRGSITCVVGPNGAGKSTLMGTISGLLRPRLGEITFDGHVISGSTPKQILTRGLSQIPQAHSLFADMTVRENVEMGAFTVDDRALVRKRLAAVEELYPIVSERADEKAGALSGGQQRLVEFARCLMLDPSLIMLDEPSMGLDPQTRQMVFEMIQLMNQQGKTILLVEQNARAGLKLSTHGVVLENGVVRLTGSGREVLEHPEIGALYLGGAVSAAATP
jgi:branched-chain amino acid transport system ATP-binding protein